MSGRSSSAAATALYSTTLCWLRCSSGWSASNSRVCEERTKPGTSSDRTASVVDSSLWLLYTVRRCVVGALSPGRSLFGLSTATTSLVVVETTSLLRSYSVATRRATNG